MNKIRLRGPLALLVIAAIWAFAGCAKISVNPGDMVAAKWTDGKFYLAKINECKGGGCVAEFHDGSTRELKIDEIKAIPGELKLAAGDKVWAVWETTNAFHDGVAKEVSATGALVEWAEGGTPSQVPFGKIIKK